MQKQVLHNQSLLDFTLHHCGTLDALLKAAIENNKSITSELIPSEELIVPKGIVSNDIVQFYSSKGIKPAFGNLNSNSMIPELGIGTMVIGSTFIVR
jgi:hypothetical protein